MSLSTPTTQQINDNIIAQLETSLNQSVPLLPRSFLRVLAKALSGVFILLYKYAGFSFLQQFVQTASASPTVVNGATVRPLVEWGRLVGVADPVPATAAELVVNISVEDLGGVLPSGTQLLNAANGVTYITIGAVALGSFTVQATIRAASDQAGGGGLGALGNLAPGDEVSFANPLSNVGSTATVSAQTVTAANAESTDAYRQRVIDRFQKKPQGGAYADYEQWGEEVAGILNVYPYTSECPGQVDLYVEATEASSASADGIPTPAQLQAVLESVEFDRAGLATRRPANALANAFPIERVGFDVRVPGLLVEDLAQVREDIEFALVAYFKSREPFIPGLSVPPRRDRVTRSGLGGVVDDIVSANSGIFSGVTLESGGVVVDVYSLGVGEKAKLRSLEWF
jgi:uncharacterized phage protein gp47/JayE